MRTDKTPPIRTNSAFPNGVPPTRTSTLDPTGRDNLITLPGARERISLTGIMHRPNSGSSGNITLAKRATFSVEVKSVVLHYGFMFSRACVIWSSVVITLEFA
jgi:hypothetical protein